MPTQKKRAGTAIGRFLVDGYHSCSRKESAGTDILRQGCYEPTCPVSRDALLDPATEERGRERVPPALAVEVAGLDDTVEMLREEAPAGRSTTASPSCGSSCPAPGVSS